MFTSSIFVIVGAILDRRTWLLTIPSLTFVFLYSFLPHKELRFIIYVFPLLNVASAEACKRFWESAKKKKTFVRRVFALAQTGVSRFLQMNELWAYNKAEDLSIDELYQFSHLLVESNDMEKLKNLTSKSFEIVKEVQAFKGASLNYKSFP